MTNRIAWIILSAALLFCVCAGVTGSLVYYRVSPAISEPATCKDFVERLQQRGLQVKWAADRFQGTSVWVIETQGDLRSVIDYEYAEAYKGKYAKVTQHLTAASAQEYAGAHPHTFSHGRFVVEGSREMVEKIRSTLQ